MDSSRHLASGLPITGRIPARVRHANQPSWVLLPGPRPYEACLTEEDTGDAVAVDDPFVVVLALTYPISRSDMIRLPGVVQLGLHVLSPSLPIGP